MTALLDGSPISAFEMTVDEWSQLRATHKGASLTMTCGQRGVPKQSSLGLRFFALHPGTDCRLHETGPETRKHHAAKAALADAARRAGWQAHIEYVSDRRDWIADVLIIKGSKRIALEVQWSPQTSEEFARRTQRYERAGVACRWFLGPANGSRDVPGAYKIGGKGQSLEVELPGRYGAPSETLPLDEGAKRLFAGEINKHIQARVTDVGISYFMTKCFRPQCARWMSRWYIRSVRVQTRCGTIADVIIDGTKYVSFRSMSGTELVRPGAGFDHGPWWGAFAGTRVETQVQEEVARAFKRERLPSAVRYRHGSTAQVPEGYVTALYPHCSTVQGDAHLWFADPLERELNLLAWTGPFPIDEPAISRLHHCPDVGQGHCAAAARPSGATFPGAHSYATPSIVARESAGGRPKGHTLTPGRFRGKEPSAPRVEPFRERLGPLTLVHRAHQLDEELRELRRPGLWFAGQHRYHLVGN